MDHGWDQQEVEYGCWPIVVCERLVWDCLSKRAEEQNIARTNTQHIDHFLEASICFHEVVLVEDAVSGMLPIFTMCFSCCGTYCRWPEGPEQPCKQSVADPMELKFWNLARTSRLVAMLDVAKWKNSENLHNLKWRYSWRTKKVET